MTSPCGSWASMATTDAVVTPGDPLSEATATRAIAHPVPVCAGEGVNDFAGAACARGPAAVPPAGSTATATFPAAASHATAPASAGLTATVTSVAPFDALETSEPLPEVTTLMTTALPLSTAPPLPGQPALPLAWPLTA